MVERPTTVEPFLAGGLRAALDALLADRHGPDARALFIHLAGYSERRVRHSIRSRYADLLTSADCEELVGDVLFELMSGALATFRGDTIGQLMAFVRCICDRVVWRCARKRIRERETLHESGPVAQLVRSWNGSVPSPDAHVQLPQTSPLRADDSAYLLRLLRAGSRAELARVEGVSRAAVTQRVQRIQRRIAELSESEQEAAEAWFTWEASRHAATPNC